MLRSRHTTLALPTLSATKEASDQARVFEAALLGEVQAVIAVERTGPPETLTGQSGDEKLAAPSARLLLACPRATIGSHTQGRWGPGKPSLQRIGSFRKSSDKRRSRYMSLKYISPPGFSNLCLRRLGSGSPCEWVNARRFPCHAPCAAASTSEDLARHGVETVA